MNFRNFDLRSFLGSFKRPTVFQVVLMGAALLVGIGLFLFSRSIVSCWNLTGLAGEAPLNCPNRSQAPTQMVTNEFGTLVPVVATSTPDVSIPQVEDVKPWDGASRVNILVMGYDYGEWSSERACPCRTDTMIVLTIDPISKTAGMISVPRDMWVEIPPYGYHKINTANYLGDANKLPGGGGELARKTVERFLGVPIQYYVMLDFNAFTTVVQTIAGKAGICMEIPQQITIDPLGEHNTQTIGPGPDCLNGAETLAYARMRHTEQDDVDRSTRQMQVILAVRDAVLRPGNWGNLLAHSTDLYNQVSAGVKTNFPNLPDAIRLAKLALSIPLDKIQQHVINYTMMAPTTIYADNVQQDILRPFPDKIREVVDQTFGTGSEKPLAASDPNALSLEEALPLMKDEAASVIVINGSGVEGMAAKTADYLKSQGVNVTAVGNMGDYNEPYQYLRLPNKTGMIVHAGKPYAMQYFMKLMNTDSFVMTYDPDATADVLLVIGADWASNNPMP